MQLLWSFHSFAFYGFLISYTYFLLWVVTRVWTPLKRHDIMQSEHASKVRKSVGNKDILSIDFRISQLHRDLIGRNLMVVSLRFFSSLCARRKENRSKLQFKSNTERFWTNKCSQLRILAGLCFHIKEQSTWAHLQVRNSIGAVDKVWRARCLGVQTIFPWSTLCI